MALLLLLLWEVEGDEVEDRGEGGLGGNTR